MPWVWKSLLRDLSHEKGKGPGHSLKELQHLEIKWKINQERRLRKREIKED